MLTYYYVYKYTKMTLLKIFRAYPASSRSPTGKPDLMDQDPRPFAVFSGKAKMNRVLKNSRMKMPGDAFNHIPCEKPGFPAGFPGQPNIFLL